MNMKKRIASAAAAAALAVSAGTACFISLDSISTVKAVDSLESAYTWDSVEVGGGGFVSSIVAGKENMYLRTDVGGAYLYNYDTERWDQLFGFINEADKGYLSVKGIAIDPTDDMTAYFLCGCAYFSNAGTRIYKTTDGGKTFTYTDVTKLIQVHGNGDGRECIEPIAVDPDNPDTIYAGGDVCQGSSALIKSTDGGKTWNPVAGYDALGLFDKEVKYPMWTEDIARCCQTGEYNQQNGIGTIKIYDGKVYVGTSVTGQTNIHVADVKDDVFTEASPDLPTDNYPLSITDDGNGNLFFTYIAGLAFSGGAGGAYKYNVESGKVTDISPTKNAFGGVMADPKDPNKLVVRTCGVWSDQWWEEEWTDGSIAWGDHFYRSEDGGTTWTDITPGQMVGQYTDNKYFVSLPLKEGNSQWVKYKAIHWGSAMIIDPRNPDKTYMTSGNGVFCCDNTWAEKNVQMYFKPDGVEEVVPLDMCSNKGQDAQFVIGDYDGFSIHSDNTTTIYNPSMGKLTDGSGSTGNIAQCSTNEKVLARVAEHGTKGYLTKDGCATWTEVTFPYSGTDGQLEIVELEDGTIRLIKSGNGQISYSDDDGETWSTSTGVDGSGKRTVVMADPENPQYVYAWNAKYNQYYFYSKSKADFEDAHYVFMVSDDYGKTFKAQDVCMYDECDVVTSIGFLGNGEAVLAAGYYGCYISKDHGASVEKLDTVSYAKTIGYGAPKAEGSPNTLFIYGRPADSDPEGVYMSEDKGKTWVLINADHLFGGTGNGNFLCGDMNTYGKVYMSTVGCGLVYGSLTSDVPPVKVTTTTTTTDKTPSDTTTTTVTTAATTAVSTDITTAVTTDVTAVTTEPLEIGKATMYGDVNLDGEVTVSDIILLNKYTSNSANLTPTQLANADVDQNNDVTSLDTICIMKYLVNSYVLPEVE